MSAEGIEVAPCKWKKRQSKGKPDGIDRASVTERQGGDKKKKRGGWKEVEKESKPQLLREVEQSR